MLSQMAGCPSSLRPRGVPPDTGTTLSARCSSTDRHVASESWLHIMLQRTPAADARLRLCLCVMWTDTQRGIVRSQACSAFNYSTGAPHSHPHHSTAPSARPPPVTCAFSVTAALTGVSCPPAASGSHRCCASPCPYVSESCLFRCSAHFLIRLFGFLLLFSCIRFFKLYIFWI